MADEDEITNEENEEEEGSGARISERGNEGNSTHNPDHRSMEEKRRDVFPEREDHLPDSRSEEKRRGEIFED
ncbi:MAG TPA: hypothetical protein VEA37_00700 [Flavobacterium sp.]|nr:hypothetical protein [Flavobacterium sp.]